MKKQVVNIPGTSPVRHLSRAIKWGNLLFIAGTVGRDPATSQMANDIAGQTRQTLENIQAACQAAGTSLDNVLKMTCYLQDLADKPAFDEVYVTYFQKDPPTRACFQVGNLGTGVLLEIEAIAGIPE